jgi:hypothetical protein
MSQHAKVFRFLLSIIALACPSISYASEERTCKGDPLYECVKKLGEALGSLDICMKRVCGKKTSSARHIPSSKEAAPTSTARTETAPPTPTATAGIETAPPMPQAFFLRADKLDNPYPGLTAAPSAGQALGASINYTGNEFVQTAVKTKSGANTGFYTVSTTDSVTVTGLASLAMVNPDPYSKGVWTLSDPNSTIVEFVPTLISVSANGFWDHPTKPFGDTSALKVGPEFNFRFRFEDDFMIYAGIAPFYQTDFYWKSNGEGATVSVTPSYLPFLLNGAGGQVRYITGGWLDGFLEVRAEATYLNVGQVGQPLLRQGSSEWLGGAVRSYVFFLPEVGHVLSKADYPYLVDRISFVGTYQNYWDANSHGTAGMFSAALNYKLTGCDSSVSPNQPGPVPGAVPVVCQYGSPSVSAQYDWGTDRDTLQHIKKIQVKLNYAY